MAVTYVVGGLNIIAINEIAPDMLNKLAEAMRLARKAVQDAVEGTVVALHVVSNALRTGLDLGEAISLLHPEFARHLTVHFRLSTSTEIFQALEALNRNLQRLVVGMRSADLRLAEYGYNWMAPKGSGVIAYVKMPLSYAFSGGPAVNGCLNKDPGKFNNPADVNIRFDRLRDTAIGDLVNTLIHECTHKYLATADLLVSGLPFKSVAEYESTWRAIGVDAPMGRLADLTPVQAINDAYVVTNYVLYMPLVDLRASAAQMELTIRGANQGIGAVNSNRRVFDSAGNDDL